MASSEQTTPHSVTSAAATKHRSWGLTLLWLAPLLLLLAVFVYGMLTKQPAGPSAPQVGRPVPDFTLPDLQGRPIQLSALRGKVIFINVWATWCPPCIDEMPTIQQLYDRLHARGLEVLAVSIDALGAQVVAPFARKYQLTFPILLDPKGIVERLYHTGGVPESFIVDKQGLLVQKVIGPRDWTHPQLLALFERLLQAPAAADATTQ